MRPVHSTVAVVGLLALFVTSSCGGNRDRLLADLQSPRPEVRALALKKLSDDATSADLILFTQAAKDVAGIVRAEATAALGKSQDPRVVDLLGELLTDQDERVQAEAARALAEIDHPKAKSYLTLQYARHGRSIRLAIVEALEKANVPGAMTEVVTAESRSLWDRNVEALESGTLAERVAAAEALGRSGRPEAVKILSELARDRQVVLAAAAVRALAEVGDRGLSSAILPLLQERYPALREAASEALGRLQDASATEQLGAMALERDSASAAAVEALLALPRSGKIDGVLCAIAADGAGQEAHRISRELRARGGCPLEPLAERLSRPAAQAGALQAVHVLGPMALPLLPSVLPLLESPDASLRMAALEAVGAVGDASAGKAVEKVATAELARLDAQRADWVRTAPKASAQERPVEGNGLTTLLGKVEEARAAKRGAESRMPVPTELVDDVSPEDLEAAQIALRVLGMVKAEGARARLEPLVRDTTPELRSAARQGLAFLGGATAELALPELVDGTRASRLAVAQALAESGPEGRARLLSFLPRIGGDRAPVLEALLHHEVPASAAAELVPLLEASPGEAALAAVLLARSGVRSAAEALAKELEDPTLGSRREFLQALGELGDASHAPLIARDLFHDSPEVRAAAAEALARVGTRDQTEQLKALEGDYHRRVREAAGAALTRVQGKQG